MSGDWKPGTVAKATVRGVPNVRIVRGDGHWAVAADTDDFIMDSHSTALITDVRPLVVLDLDEAYVRMLPQFLRRLGDREQSEDDKPGRLLVTTAALRRIADQIEAQTRPARIPEPGLWGVVRAREANAIGDADWVHVPTGAWASLGGSRLATWDALIDPVLVREGVA
jgi:hypothetical protein